MRKAIDLGINGESSEKQAEIIIDFVLLDAEGSVSSILDGSELVATLRWLTSAPVCLTSQRLRSNASRNLGVVGDSITTVSPAEWKVSVVRVI